MNYPEDNYDNVHDNLIDMWRDDYERWLEVEQANRGDSHKCGIAQIKQNQIIIRAKKLNKA